MTDRLGEQGAIQYAQNNPTSAGVSRLGGAGALQAAIADALSNGLSSLNGSRLGGKGRIYALAAGAGPMFLFNNSEVGVWYDPSDFSTLFQDNAGTTPVTAVGQPVGKMLDKSGNGYHATQPTSTARPILGRHPITGRRNLLLNPLATTTSVTVADTGTVSQNGNTIYSLVPTAVASITHLTELGFVVPAGVQYVQSVIAKANGYDRIFLWNPNTGAGGAFDLSTGVVLGGGASASITSLGGGWYKCSYVYTQPTSATNVLRIYILEPGTISTGAWATAPDGVSGVLVSEYQGELGSTPTAYQKVVSTYDVTEAGVNDAYYSDGDGVDDSLTIQAGGGGSTGFFLCTAVRVDGGAGTNRVIYSDAGTNTGYILRINASNQLELAAGNGTAYTLSPTTDTLTAGPYVVTAWDDGTNLNVQVNSGTVGSVARPVVSAGNADFRIGKDYGAATGYFNGAIYPYVYVKNAQNVDANDRAAVKSYVASKAGVSI